MTQRSVGWRVTLALIALTLFLGGSVFAASGFDRRPHAEAPMKVQTEGATVGELLQAQAHMADWLASERSAAVERPVRIELTPQDLALVNQPARPGEPLKIGLVKGFGPSIEVMGLSTGTAVRGPNRGIATLVQPTEDGGYVWSTAIEASGAGGVRLHVENMSLPDNAALYVYSPDGEAYGPYIGIGPDGSGEFWTTSVFGERAILQLRLTAPVTPRDLAMVSFSIREAGLIAGRGGDTVTPQAALAFCGNASCIVDATCSISDPTGSTVAASAKLAVAKMEWVAGAFLYTCTGGLISDNDPSASNYFLTANHCLSKSNTAKNVSFYWRFATSACNGSCPSNNGWPYKTTGSSVSATNRIGDFTLLHLNANPPAGSVFLGWTNAAVANTNGAHLYRVSNPNFGPQVYSAHDVSTSAPQCQGWPRGERIYSRDIVGATDGGSSGSPVLNGSAQIVGQLSGGCGTNVNDVCDAVHNATVDGALANYYSRVQPFLNP